jgi:hypothetical protein
VDKKQLFIFVGIGLVVSGVATMLILYQGLSAGNATTAQPLSENSNQFNLQEIHANPKLVVHDHVLLTVIRNSDQIQVPKEIGISSDLWKDHSLDRYGPATLSPMHTHDTSGTIHIESTAVREFTFGEFLQVWGIDTGKIVRLSNSQGNEMSDYENHVLRDGERLLLKITE